MIHMVIKNANLALAFFLELGVLGVAFVLVFALNSVLIHVLAQ